MTVQNLLFASIHDPSNSPPDQKTKTNKKTLNFHIPVRKLKITDTYTTAELCTKCKLSCQS